MKDNLFEMLLNLFEQSLSQLQEEHQPVDSQDDHAAEAVLHNPYKGLYIKASNQKSTRIFTCEEQMRMTKASYQFLMRMKAWGVIDEYSFELVMNELELSESSIINLEETKWTIRQVLSNTLNEKQLAFLDAVLNQVKDKLTEH